MKVSRLVFALPLVLLLPTNPQAGSPVPGDMGLEVADLSPEACRAAGVRFGVAVVYVAPGGPADRKGIEEGDILTQYEGVPVRSAAWLYGRIRRDGPGFLAGVHVLHEGSERWLGFVTLAAAPMPPPTVDELDDRFAALARRIDALEAHVAQLDEALSRRLPEEASAK